jgi:hypothetical protein
MSDHSEDDDALPSSSRRILAHVLARKERDSQQMHQLLKLTLAKLDDQSHRATDAERRATECLIRARAAIDARAQADADAAAARAELALYKIQLDQAQREINRAQEFLDGLEARRLDAEQDAAHARSVARKLQEERAVEAAREQGKQQGYDEGLRQGLLLGRREVDNNRVRSRRHQQEEHNRHPPSRSRRPADVHFTQVIPESPQQSPSERSSPHRRVVTGYVLSHLYLYILNTTLCLIVSAQNSRVIVHLSNNHTTPLHLPFHPHHPNVHDHNPSHAPAWRPPHLSQPVRAHTHLMTIRRLRSSSPFPSPPPFHPWGRWRCIYRRALALYVIHRFGNPRTTGYHVPKTPPVTVVSPSCYPRLMNSMSS